MKIAIAVAAMISLWASAHAQSCWACMHGCTDAQRIRLCHLDGGDRAQSRLKGKSEDCERRYLDALARGRIPIDLTFLSERDKTFLAERACLRVGR